MFFDEQRTNLAHFILCRLLEIFVDFLSLSKWNNEINNDFCLSVRRVSMFVRSFVRSFAQNTQIDLKLFEIRSQHNTAKICSNLSNCLIWKQKTTKNSNRQENTKNIKWMKNVVYKNALFVPFFFLLLYTYSKKGDLFFSSLSTKIEWIIDCCCCWNNHRTR